MASLSLLFLRCHLFITAGIEANIVSLGFRVTPRRTPLNTITPLRRYELKRLNRCVFIYVNLCHSLFAELTRLNSFRHWALVPDVISLRTSWGHFTTVHLYDVRRVLLVLLMFYILYKKKQLNRRLGNDVMSNSWWYIYSHELETSFSHFFAIAPAIWGTEMPRHLN